MYLESLDAFVEQAEELFKANPLKTRYVMKYRHCDGKLMLKVTDDDTVRIICAHSPTSPGRISSKLPPQCPPPPPPPPPPPAPPPRRSAPSAPPLPVPAIQDRPAVGPEEGREAQQPVLLPHSNRGAATGYAATTALHCFGHAQLAAAHHSPLAHAHCPLSRAQAM